MQQVSALITLRALRRQYHRFSFGDHDGVFDVSGEPAVGGGERPAVAAGADAGALAGADHGFHGDHTIMITKGKPVILTA